MLVDVPQQQRMREAEAVTDTDTVETPPLITNANTSVLMSPASAQSAPPSVAPSSTASAPRYPASTTGRSVRVIQ